MKKGQDIDGTKRMEKSWASTFTYRKEWSLIFSWKNETEEGIYVSWLYACDKLIINTPGMEISRLIKRLQNHYNEVNI